MLTERTRHRRCDGSADRTQTFRRGQDEFGRNLLHELNSDVTRETQARNLQHNP